MKNTSWSESSNLNIPHMLKSTCQFQVFEASVPPTHPLSAQKCSDRSPPQVIIFPDRFYEEEQFLRKASSISCSSKVQFLRLLQTDFTDNCSARLGSMHVCDSLQLGQVYCWLLDTYSRCTLYTVQYVNSRKPHISTTSAILFRPLPQIPILSKTFSKTRKYQSISMMTYQRSHQSFWIRSWLFCRNDGSNNFVCLELEIKWMIFFYF